MALCNGIERNYTFGTVAAPRLIKMCKHVGTATVKELTISVLEWYFQSSNLIFFLVNTQFLFVLQAYYEEDESVWDPDN